MNLHSPTSQIPGFGEDDIASRVLPVILRRQAERLGDARFLTVCGRSVGFAGMEILTNRLANGLRRLGVERSHRVAILLPNCLEFVAVWFAVSKLGAIEVPSNPDLKGELLAHNLRSCGARVLVADAARLSAIAAVQAQLPQLHTLVLTDIQPADARAAGIRVERLVTYEDCLAGGENFDAPEIHFSDPMAILWTSGTTGSAKGVVMSHHHCFEWVRAMALNLGYTGRDSYFSPLPLFHTDAQMFGVYMPLVFGTPGTLVERFSASRFWGQVRESGATATNLLGAMAVILMRAAPSADDDNPVRICQCIPMAPDRQAFERRFAMTLVTGYGQTETSFVTLDHADLTREGSCGRAHPDWEVAVFDEHDMPVPPGVIGEIVSRPRKNWFMFSGYDGQEAKTAQTLRNLWYHSGDAGWLDADGWLHFKHRLSETIRRRGENISAFEVESIADLHPEIVESAAFGVPSEFTEEDLMVVAMRREGSNLGPEDLLAHFRAHAPRHMTPRYVEITDEPLPRTPTEKISRASLRQKGLGERTFDAGAR